MGGLHRLPETDSCITDQDDFEHCVATKTLTKYVTLGIMGEDGRETHASVYVTANKNVYRMRFISQTRQTCNKLEL